MKSLALIVLVGSGIYVGVCALLYFGQRNILYFPRPEVESNIAEVVWLETSGAKLKLWLMPGTADEALIYFGGNAEPIEHNLENFREWFPELNIYLVNYRGFGGSTGKPSEAGLCGDAYEVFDYLKPKHSRISVIGRSLGSGVATCLASARDVKKLALITPFDSVLAVARNIYYMFPVALLLKDTFDSVSYASGINADVLILLATEDRVIPPHHGKTLAAAFRPEQVQINTIEGADHIDVSNFAEFGESLRDFL